MSFRATSEERNIKASKCSCLQKCISILSQLVYSVVYSTKCTTSFESIITTEKSGPINCQLKGIIKLTLSDLKELNKKRWYGCQMFIYLSSFAFFARHKLSKNLILENLASFRNFRMKTM